MIVLSKSCSISLLIVGIFLIVHQSSPVSAQGCTDNESCTAVCGFAGAGECVDQKYCKCADCPMRNVYDTIKFPPKICSLSPTCMCPETVSVTDRRLYTGHVCMHGLTPVCVCFCLPLRAGALFEVVKCPIPESMRGSTTTTTSATLAENLTL